MSELDKKPIEEVEENGNNPLLAELEQFTKKDEEIFYASQSQLIVWRFKRHKLAMFSLFALILFYAIALVPGFFATYGQDERFKKYSYAPPTRIRWFAEGEGFVGPYIYASKTELNLDTFATTYVEDPEQGRFPLGLFIRGNETYKAFWLFETNLRLLGVRNQTGEVEVPPLLLFGSDQIGRDVFSRTCYGAQISLTIGLVGVMMSFVMGIALGGLSGYLGGLFDAIILVIIDLLQTIPQMPLWMTLAAAVPREMPVVQRYFMMTVVLSFLGWTGLARVVRGRLLAMREEDYALAAKGAGASNWRIVMRHLIPGFTSHLIVTITINIPSMILGEVSLGFLGLGMVKPAISWGVLLQDAQNIMAIANQPWMMIPAIIVIVTVLLFNFVGDGLRDAADPYVM